MTIHDLIREKCLMAAILAQDGAFMSAARELRNLAGKLEAHYSATMPQDRRSGQPRRAAKGGVNDPR